MAAPEIDSTDGVEVGGVLLKAGNVDHGVMALTGNVEYTDDDAAVSLGTLQSGTMLLDIMIDVINDFTDTGTNMLSVGISTSHGRYVANFDVTSAHVFEPPMLSTWGNIITTKEVFAYYTGSNNNSTDGSAKIVMSYVQF